MFVRSSLITALTVAQTLRCDGGQPSVVRAPARPSLAGRSVGHAMPPASR